MTFVDGPEDPQEHETFDWGKAALEAIESWKHGENNPLYDWSTKSHSTVIDDGSGYGRT